MWRLIFVYLSLFFIAPSLAAETVVLRTAEHGDFTRVVLDMERPNDVKVSQASNRITVTLPPQVKRIEAKDFFRRIGRDRIADVTVIDKQRQFELELNCDCEFTRSGAGETMLVLDIRARSQVAETALERATETRLWGMVDGKARARLGFGTQLSDTEVAANTQPESAGSGGSTQTQPRLSLSNVDQEQDNFSQRRLLSNLNAVVDRTVASDVQSGRDNGDDQIAFHAQAAVSNEAILEVEQRARQVLDNCDQIAHLNPVSWPKYDDARAYLREQRARVVSSHEEMDDAGIRGLAQTYMSLAMGAEAKALLKSLQAPLRPDSDLLVLSDFVDGDFNVLLSDAVPAIPNCSELLIWFLLDGRRKPVGTSNSLSLSETQLAQVRLDFDRWPPALQGVFGAPLAKALAEVGATDAAGFSLRRSAGGAEMFTGERAMTAARMAQLENDPKSATELLAPIIAADEDKAPEAVIALAELTLEQGQVLEPAQMAALESYREEHKGTAIEGELIRARLRAAIEENSIAQAIEMAGEYAEVAKPNQMDMVLDEIGEGINALKSDARFLEEAVSLPEHYFNRIAKTAQDQMRSRMAELGFPELAEQLGAARGQNAEQRASVGEKGVTRNGQNKTGTVVNGTDAEIAKARQPDSPINTSDASDIAADGRATASIEDTPRIVPPIAKAVRETEELLSGLADLKQDLTDLGL